MIKLKGQESAQVEELLLEVGKNIDYKPMDQNKITIGKILSFKQAPESESIWMQVNELENPKNKEWVSLPVWKEQYDSNLFGSKPKFVKNDSPEPEDDDLPF
jgi:hypothetical protein